MIQPYNSLTKLSFCKQREPTTTKLPSTKQTRTESPVINHDNTTTTMTLPSPRQFNKKSKQYDMAKPAEQRYYHNFKVANNKKNTNAKYQQNHHNDKEEKPQLLSILMLPS